MKWIRVKDELPKAKNAEHLVTDGKHVDLCDFVEWYYEGNKKPKWNWVLPHKMKEVTHWMEKPKPPKE